MSFVKERIGNLSTVTLAVILIVTLVVSIVFAISIGVVEIPFDKVWHIVSYNILYSLGIDIGGHDIWAHGSMYDIVWNIRSPRVFMAAIVGMTLALAGVVMQATVQNPLADPYILGMSSGASLGATLSIAGGITGIGGMVFGEYAIAFFAFIGSFVSAIAVLALSSAGGKATSVKLVLSGTIISSLLGAFSNLIVVLAADAEEMQELTYWLLGSFGAASWVKLGLPIVVLITGLLFFLTQSRALNTMLMGDDVATTLGIDLAKKRKIYVTMTALLTATAVCFCGVIGFVGLMIPHIVRALTGNNHWKLIPISCLVGGIFMVFADLLARTVLPGGGELPIGIITAVCGAPVFAYIMIKRTYSFS